MSIPARSNRSDQSGSSPGPSLSSSSGGMINSPVNLPPASRYTVAMPEISNGGLVALSLKTPPFANDVGVRYRGLCLYQ